MTKTYFKTHMNIVNEGGPNQYYIMEVWALDYNSPSIPNSKPSPERMCIVNGQTMIDVEEKANLIATALNILERNSQTP